MDRVLYDYTRGLYVPAAAHYRRLAADGFTGARTLAENIAGREASDRDLQCGNIIRRLVKHLRHRGCYFRQLYHAGDCACRQRLFIPCGGHELCGKCDQRCRHIDCQVRSHRRRSDLSQ